MIQTPTQSKELSSIQLSEILSSFSLEFDSICTNHTISGSPERVLSRLVIKDTNSQLFLLEEIHPNQLRKKQNIAEILTILKESQLPYLNPYILSIQHTYQLPYNNSYYQLSRYLDGTPLSRTNYLHDSWRGEKISAFLISLKKTTEKLSHLLPTNQFKFSSYLQTTISQMNHHHPHIASQIQPITTHLKTTTLPMLETLPITFSHGDIHPLNIIWEKDDIKAIIDWEFCSYKTELYDAANLLGCLGVEHPSGLLDNFSSKFLENIHESEIYTEKSYNTLVDLIILLRIAWLTEWLKKHDEDMISLELDYIKLLFGNKDYLNEELEKKRKNIL